MNEVPKDQMPKLAQWLLSKFVPAALHEEFLGDLEEMFQERSHRKGVFEAQLMYWIDALHLLLGFSSFSWLRNLRPSSIYKHYLVVARRNLIKNRLHSLINIISLAVGMGICLLIFQYVYFEKTYDTFHEDYLNTYRVIIEETNSEANKTSPISGYALAVSAQKEIPEIRQYVRKSRFNRGAIVTNPVNQAVFHEDVNDLLFVDTSFFQVFNFPLKKGQQEHVFIDKYSVVITEETAQKYFGFDDPIGKSLKINGPPSPGTYTVSGIVETPPINSHLQFDFLIGIDNYIDYGWGGAVKKQGGWNGFPVINYLTLEESADVDLVCEKLNRLIAQHSPTGQAEKDIVRKASLQPIADIHLKSDHYSFAGYINTTGSSQNNSIFTAISFFILLIAWINYINLSTAKSLNRAREIGVRKSIGALKRQIVGQFMVESVFVNLIAALLAIGVAYLCLPILNNILGKEIAFTLLQRPLFWVVFLTITLLGALLSGLYPAFVLSSFKISNILHAKRTSKVGNVDLRKGLITFQFLTSLVLISATYLVYQQVSLLKNHELNVDIEKVLVARIQQGDIARDSINSVFQSFKHEILRHSAISSATTSVYIPGQFGVTSYRRLDQAESAAPYTRSIFAGQDFLETYGLKIITGRSFSNYQPEDKVAIINESASKIFGFNSPEEALQQQLTVKDNPRTIVGVVEDFHWHSLKESHMPYVIDLGSVDQQHPYLSIRMDMTNTAESLAQISATFHSFFPGSPFDYFFADESYNRVYQSEVQFGKIFFSFTLLAIFISCIGLLALVSYSATLRVKEIGIRKVLGATTGNLMFLLSREYLILLLAANLLAFPIIFYWGTAWLESYATRIALGLESFLLPGLILLLISLATVSYIAFAAAKTNPIESLKKE